MKKILSLIASLFIALFLVSCDNSQNDAKNDQSNTSSQNPLSFNTLEFSGKNAYGKVSNTTETFSFLDEIRVGPNTTYKVCLDMYGFVDVPTKTVSLSVGDNTFYILENTSNQENLYTVTIRRKDVYTVQFTDGKGAVVAPKQLIEEDGFAKHPTNPTKNGYDFISWNESFSSPITSDIIITSNWRINWGKMLSLYNSTVTGMKYSYTNGDTKEIIIPSSINGVTVTNVGITAFAFMEWTEYIALPDTVTHIETSAFRDCIRLEKVILSKNLKYIGQMAFEGCSSLKTIEFNGTISDWNKITKNANWNRYVPATYVICSDGKIQI